MGASIVAGRRFMISLAPVGMGTSFRLALRWTREGLFCHGRRKAVDYGTAAFHIEIVRQRSGDDE